MTLTIARIQDTRSDENLLKVLQAELNRVFPPESRRDVPVFLSRLQSASRGLRAMAVTFELDVSMAMDDLAWHFVNHPNLDLCEETLLGLRELEATEVAEIFENAFAAVKPHWNELAELTLFENASSKHDWLDAQGIQKLIDPLNKRMWRLLSQWPMEGLMHYWITYVGSSRVDLQACKLEYSIVSPK